MKTEYFLFVHHTTSILAKLSTLVTSVVLYSLTRVTLMSPHVSVDNIFWSIYIYILTKTLFLCLRQQSKMYFGDGVYGMSKS